MGGDDTGGGGGVRGQRSAAGASQLNQSLIVRNTCHVSVVKSVLTDMNGVDKIIGTPIVSLR